MAHVALPRLAVNPEPIKIYQDSCFMEGLSCLPVFGFIPAYIQHGSIAEQRMKIDEADATKVPRRIRLIEVWNHYKIASIVRQALSIALIISVYAMSLLSGVGAVILTGLLLYDAGVLNADISHNINVIQDLKDGKRHPDAPR